MTPLDARADELRRLHFARFHLDCTVPWEKLNGSEQNRWRAEAERVFGIIAEDPCPVCRGEDLGTTDGPDGEAWPVKCGVCEGP